MDKSRAYQILGVSPHDGEAEIKAAYRALAQKYSPDDYENGPLRAEAEAKMNEINEAFDLLMGDLRTGAERGPARPAGRRAAAGGYPAIRQLINDGRVDDALSELSDIAGGADDAEWNFLMGSAYYYKGWLGQALQYIQRAVQLDPGNREYQAALRKLQGNADGRMAGNPYGGASAQAQAMNCACNTCSMIICMDTCCGCMRGC